MSEGLYQKYNVLRTDGREVGPCFVLEFGSDPYALEALKAYAEACRFDKPELSKDLFDQVRLHQEELERAYAESAVQEFNSEASNREAVESPPTGGEG